jgi:hypothetical protein
MLEDLEVSIVVEIMMKLVKIISIILHCIQLILAIARCADRPDQQVAAILKPPGNYRKISRRNVRDFAR